jgi:hypothetical protein
MIDTAACRGDRNDVRTGLGRQPSLRVRRPCQCQLKNGDLQRAPSDDMMLHDSNKQILIESVT